MYFWSFSSDDAAKNLAYDEALLDVLDESAHASGQPQPDVLRIWEMPITAVVLGRSSKAADEANVANCNRHNVPVLRRCSGGSTILAGMGCLMYAACLSLNRRPELAMIDAAHDYVMLRLTTTLQKLEFAVKREGICDLTIAGKKISGNALRLKRHTLLYHGTILYSLDLSLLSVFLRDPARQPAYRTNRSHQDFVTNVEVSRGALVRSLRAEFDANADWSDFPLRIELEAKATQLLNERYSMDAWNLAR